jgi:hypothetical protein
MIDIWPPDGKSRMALAPSPSDPCHITATKDNHRAGRGHRAHGEMRERCGLEVSNEKSREMHSVRSFFCVLCVFLWPILFCVLPATEVAGPGRRRAGET